MREWSGSDRERVSCGWPLEPPTQSLQQGLDLIDCVDHVAPGCLNTVRLMLGVGVLPRRQRSCSRARDRLPNIAHPNRAPLR